MMKLMKLSKQTLKAQIKTDRKVKGNRFQIDSWKVFTENGTEFEIIWNKNLINTFQNLNFRFWNMKDPF